MFLSLLSVSNIQELFQSPVSCASSITVGKKGLIFISPINGAEDSSSTLYLFQEADELLMFLCVVVFIYEENDIFN